MNECRKCREVLIEALYDELGPADKEAFERHLASCPDCAAERTALNETLRLMDRRRRPDPGAEFWDGYWDRLSRRGVWEATAEGRRPSLAARLGRALTSLPRWSYQVAGAAALLLLGILIGRLALGPTAGERRMTASANAPVSSAAVQAADFIDRSQVLLLGLVNYDPATQDAYAFDLAGKKAYSRELVNQAPAVLQSLDKPGQRRLRELVSELEVILMQIANLGSGQDLEGVELIKQGVDRRGLFLKIDLDRMSRAARGGAAGPSSRSGAAGTPKKSLV